MYFRKILGILLLSVLVLSSVSFVSAQSYSSKLTVEFGDTFDQHTAEPTMLKHMTYRDVEDCFNECGLLSRVHLDAERSWTYHADRLGSYTKTIDYSLVPFMDDDYYTIEVVPASSNIWDDSSIGIKNGILNGIVSFEPRNTLKAPHGGDVYRNGTVGVTIMDLKTRVMNTYQTKNFNRRSVDLSTLNIPLTVGTQYAVSCIIEPNEYGWGMATLEKQFYT